MLYDVRSESYGRKTISDFGEKQANRPTSVRSFSKSQTRILMKRYGLNVQDMWPFGTIERFLQRPLTLRKSAKNRKFCDVPIFRSPVSAPLVLQIYKVYSPFDAEYAAEFKSTFGLTIHLL